MTKEKPVTVSMFDPQFEYNIGTVLKEIEEGKTCFESKVRQRFRIFTDVILSL